VFDELTKFRKEGRARRAIDNAMVTRKGKLNSLPGDDGAFGHDRDIANGADSQDCGFGRIDGGRQF